MARKSQKKTAVTDARGAAESRYRAPALEKGLEILELLSGQREPLTMAAISERLGRSTSEIFRMLQVLEQKGYIEKSPSGDGYRITNRLFTLGMAQPPVQTLVETALPVMRRLANAIGQSCHLAVPSSDQIVVIGPSLTSEDYTVLGQGMGIGVNEGADTLKAALDQALCELENAGAIQPLSIRWFGDDLTIECFLPNR